MQQYYDDDGGEYACTLQRVDITLTNRELMSAICPVSRRKTVVPKSSE